MARPNPQFNTPLSPSQINAELPFYPLYGVTPDNKYTPISITENGQLSIGSVTITGPVTVSDVVIKGVDPDNSDTTEDIAVYNLGPSHGYAIRSSIFDVGGNHLIINPDGSINVNVESGITGTNLNQYSENNAVPSGIQTTLFTYTVPAGKTYNLDGFVGWGTYDAEFLVLINGTNSGGGRNSPTQRTLEVDYLNTPIVVSAGQTITVTVQHYSNTTEQFRLNTLAELI